MTRLWATVVVPQLFAQPVRCKGRRVLVGDGIKVGKCGRKMPGVKLVHQQSENKAEFAMAHSLQAVGMLVHAGGGVLAVPLSVRIHEGLVWCNARKKSLYTKMLELLETVSDEPFCFVADAYYAVRPMLTGLRNNDNIFITRVKSNAVAYLPYIHSGPRKRGRPRKYGERITLASLRKKREGVLSVKSPLFGEGNVTLEYLVHDLLWKPIGQIVRFVIIMHPSKGCWFLLSMDTTIGPLEIISTYGLRFRIEVSFKQAVHSLGMFGYRFWMKGMDRLHFGDGDQHLHRKSKEYRACVLRKLHSYHVFIQAGVVAQGLLMYLATAFPQQVWKSFGSWLRTIRPDVAPSEFVVAEALRKSLPHFLASNEERHAFTKFIAERQGPKMADLFEMAA